MIAVGDRIETEEYSDQSSGETLDILTIIILEEASEVDHSVVVVLAEDGKHKRIELEIYKCEIKK